MLLVVDPPLLLLVPVPPPHPSWHVPKSTPLSRLATRPAPQQPWPLEQSASLTHTTCGSSSPPIPTHASGIVHDVPEMPWKQHTSLERQSSGPSHASGAERNPEHICCSHVVPLNPAQQISSLLGSQSAVSQTTPCSAVPV